MEQNDCFMSGRSDKADNPAPHTKFSDITEPLPGMGLILGKSTEPARPIFPKNSHRFVSGTIGLLQSVSSPDTTPIIYLGDTQWMSESSKRLYAELLKEWGLSNVPEATDEDNFNVLCRLLIRISDKGEGN